jgi:hypothetical protein
VQIRSRISVKDSELRNRKSFLSLPVADQSPTLGAPLFFEWNPVMAKFHERFGIELGVEEGTRRFVNRSLNFIFNDLMLIADRQDHINGTDRLAQFICSKLGERSTTLRATEVLIGKDFWKCLLILEAISNDSPWKSEVRGAIKKLLAETEIDIGIRWEDGHFLPAGAPVLDSALVNDSLNLLSTPEYKGVSVAFRKGLDHFLHSKNKESLLSYVLTDMYEALEAMAKIVCPNGQNRDLSANCEAFISRLRLADPYKRMLKEYIEYAN